MISCQYAIRDQKQDVQPRLKANLWALGRIFHIGFAMVNISYNLIFLKHYQRLAIRKCNSFQSAYHVGGTSNRGYKNYKAEGKIKQECNRRKRKKWVGPGYEVLKLGGEKSQNTNLYLGSKTRHESQK